MDEPVIGIGSPGARALSGMYLTPPPTHPPPSRRDAHDLLERPAERGLRTESWRLKGSTEPVRGWPNAMSAVNRAKAIFEKKDGT